jgi:hypothetical protein
MITKELIEDAKAAGFLYDKKSGRLYLDINDGEYEEEVTDKLEKLVELQRQRERQAVAVPDGWQAIPTDISDEFAERLCERLNWHPDGTSHRRLEGVAIEVTFRDMAKGYIRAMLSAAPPADTVKQDDYEEIRADQRMNKTEGFRAIPSPLR